MRIRPAMAGLAILFAATSLSAQQAPQPPQRVLNVSGQGMVTRQPDRAVIMLAVESHATTAQDAAQTNARKMDAVHAALRKLGIVAPHVQTVSYGLQPDYQQPDPRSPNPNTPRIVGYGAQNTVRVEVDSLTLVGPIIDATIAAGANRVDNLSWELRDPESARLEALRMAVEHAHAEADVVASAAGQKLGLPQSISTSGAYPPPPMPMYRVSMAAAEAAAPTPIEAGNLTITANVSISYLLEDR